MSLSAYARHRGVSPAAVTKAVQSGRIPVERDPATGKRTIDSDAADLAWAQNSDEAKAIGARAAGAVNAGGGEPVDNSDDEASDGLASPNYSLARAKREAYNAELARLKLEQAVGTLVLAADVQRQAFAAARVVRESILNIPDRLAAPLAGETDPRRVHEVLRVELTRVLSELAGGL